MIHMWCGEGEEKKKKSWQMKIEFRLEKLNVFTIRLRYQMKIILGKRKQTRGSCL